MISLIFLLINGFEDPPVFQTTNAGGIQSAIVSFVSKGNTNTSRPPSAFVGTVKLSTHESSHQQSSSNDQSKQIGTSSNFLSTGNSPVNVPSRKVSHVVQQYASANRISGVKASIRAYHSNANSPRRSKVISPQDLPGSVIPVTIATPVTNSFKIAPISENVLPPPEVNPPPS